MDHLIAAAPAQDGLDMVGAVAGDAPRIVPVHGRADDAVAVMAWPTAPFFASMADGRAMQVLAQIVQNRLTDGLRETDGLTYAPATFVDQPFLMPFGVVAAQVELRPDKTGRFFTAVSGIVADMARTPVSADEINRARAPMLDSARQNVHMLNYWADALVGADDDPRLLDTIRTRIPNLMAAKPEDIQRLAKTLLAGARPWRVVFAPAQ